MTETQKGLLQPPRTGHLPVTATFGGAEDDHWTSSTAHAQRRHMGHGTLRSTTPSVWVCLEDNGIEASNGHSSQVKGEWFGGDTLTKEFHSPSLNNPEHRTGTAPSEQI